MAVVLVVLLVLDVQAHVKVVVQLVMVDVLLVAKITHFINFVLIIIQMDIAPEYVIKTQVKIHMLS